MKRILWFSSLRYFVHHPWLIILSIVGVALGVAMVVAIDLVNQSARRAFVLSSESVVGKATHQIIGGPLGVPEEVYRKLRLEARVRLAAPIVERYVTLPHHPGRTLHLLGVDPLAEAPFRPYLNRLGGNRFNTASSDFVRWLTQPDTAVLSLATAQEMALRPGDGLTISLSGSQRTVTLLGFFSPDEALYQSATENLLLTDIATAQELIGMPGYLSRIDLIIEPGPAGDARLTLMQKLLPPGAEILSASSRCQAREKMTESFNLNLAAMSMLALLVGMFLIYNTITFSIVQRRSWIGTLRALGVTRGEIFCLVLGEAGCIGWIGTVLGLVGGIALAHSLIHLVTRTINDLYFVLAVRELAIPPLALLKGILLGIGATQLAAVLPALEATGIPPRQVLSRSLLESQVRRLVPPAALAGTGLLILGATLVFWPTQNIAVGFAALWFVVFGFALLTPGAMVILLNLLMPLLHGLLRVLGLKSSGLGLLGRMAARGVITSLSRTGVVIAALVVAVSTTIGVGILIDSFRLRLNQWLKTALQADFYLSAPNPASSSNEATVDPDLARKIANLPGVVATTTYRDVTVESSTGPMRIVALKLGPRNYGSFEFLQGKPAILWPAFQEGRGIIVSESLAFRNQWRVGSRLPLRTERGLHDFPIVGIFSDYGYNSDRGIIMMSRYTYNQWWNDPLFGSMGIYAGEGVELTALAHSLQEIAAHEGQHVVILSNRALREASLEIFDRTFAITAVLRLLATIVAFIGILSALMALQLERAREFGILRANGLTPHQLWGLVTCQTGLMGLLAGLLAIPVGLAVGFVLIFVINYRSFGWTIPMVVSPWILLQALLLALAAAFFAGLYPGLKMARTSPALALREE